MGFLNFLNKRFADDGKSERSFRFKNGRSVLIGSETSKHRLFEWHGLHEKRKTNIEYRLPVIIRALH